jgi:hypothetical protein
MLLAKPSLILISVVQTDIKKSTFKKRPSQPSLRNWPVHTTVHWCSPVLGVQRRAHVVTFMASLPAIRYVASSARSVIGSIHLQCRVKPGATKQREGIISISDSVIELRVSARAHEGEANRAVREVFCKVSYPAAGALRNREEYLNWRNRFWNAQNQT